MCEFVGCKKMLTGNSVHTHFKIFFLFTAFLAREKYSPLAELITAYFTYNLFLDKPLCKSSLAVNVGICWLQENVYWQPYIPTFI